MQYTSTHTVQSDNNIYLYNTEGCQFTNFKTISARDVGWSVLDVAFRSVITVLCATSDLNGIALRIDMHKLNINGRLLKFAGMTSIAFSV